MIATKIKRPSTAASAAYVHAFPSELGWMALVWQGERLARLSFGHRTKKDALAAFAELHAPPAKEPSKRAAAVAARLQAFAAGAADDLLDIEVEYGSVTPFQRKVLDACRAIAPGETLSYGQLATLAGAPGAARAVGSVMRKNRLPLIVPCHRVVGSCGLGGYSAAAGVTLKKKLIEREMARSE